MEIKQIIEALQTRFEGVSDAILERVAKKISKTITDEATMEAAVNAVTFQQVVESYADYRVTEAQKTAVQTYEKKYGLKDGKAVVTPTATNEPTKTTTTDDMPEWAKSLVESINSQNKIIEALKADKAINGRKAMLNEALSQMPASVKSRYEKDFARLNFKDDEDFTAWLEEAKTDFAQMQTEYQQKGATFQPPFVGGGNGKHSTEAQKDMAKNIAKNLVHNK